MNRTLKLLIFSDIFVFTGFGFFAPIMAIFINDRIVGGTIASVGIAVAITTFLRCTLQLLFAKIAKPHHRYNMVVLGTFLIVVVPFIYLLSTQIWHIYLAATIHGLACSFAHPAWYSLFAGNLARTKRGWEWSVYSSSVGIGTAIAAVVGAHFASIFGFRIVLAIVTIFVLIGALILLRLTKEDLKIKKGKEVKVIAAKVKLHQPNPPVT